MDKKKQTNKQQAEKIIESGIKYLERMTQAGFKLKNYKVADWIEAYAKGRQRYTNKDIAQLKKIFNRSSLRSTLYKVAELRFSKVTTKEGDTIVLDHEKDVTIGRASQSEEAYAKTTARKINKALRGWDKWSDVVKAGIIEDLASAGVPLKPWTGDGVPEDPIDVDQITSEHERALIKLLGKIYSYEDANEDIQQEMKDDLLAAADDAGISDIDLEGVSTDMIRGLVLGELDHFWDNRIYDSDYDRIISTITYDIIRKTNDQDVISRLISILRAGASMDETVKMLQQLTGRV